jgi:hypothetical protein
MTLKDIKEEKSNVLGVKSKVYECGFCKKDKEILVIPWGIYSQWLWISQEMGQLEWGGVFTVKDGRIESFKIPKQEVTSSICEFKEDIGGNGMVHSHHDMGAFHSRQDDEQARNLYHYSIVLSSTGYEASRRKPLPCGGFGYVDVGIEIEGCPVSNISELITEKKFETWGSAWDDEWDFSKEHKKKNNNKRGHEHPRGTLFKEEEELLVECPSCGNSSSPEELDVSNGICGFCTCDVYYHHYTGEIAYAEDFKISGGRTKK